MRRLSVVSFLCAAAMLVAAPASHAVLLHFKAFMDGPSEEPPVPSPGTGFAVVNYDSVAHTLSIDASWADLVGTTTVAHIHCCTADPFAGTVGVAVTPGTLPGFPAGVTAGDYAAVIDLTALGNYTAGFLAAFTDGTAAGAEGALIAGFEAHTAYFNIHTSFRPGGEIRGFLVPEPGVIGLLGVGLAVAFVATRRRRA
jgi:hypothetical protein